ncbi:class I SAM-dependent methyltransferase [Candidatus Roizmanbacteria bacterium]|nr:MAG: class I SAM-dependent methyltransferase [Candidatus Roizmanbacteria bacterium]
MLTDILYLLAVLSLLIFLIWASIYIISLIISWFRGAPYVATKTEDYKRILHEIVPKRGTYFLEVGCGDGRVLRYAAQTYGVRGKGVDINPIILLKGKFLTYWQKLRNISFVNEDVKMTDFSGADYIYIFLFPKLVETLKNKLLTKTKQDVTIIAHGFQISYLRKYQDKVLEGKTFKTYIYKISPR